jgi:U4/U6.U5 tri-snRNP-associated protein 2
VVDSSLDDIRKALFPTFSKADIARLDGNKSLVRDVHGVSFLPGKPCGYTCPVLYLPGWDRETSDSGTLCRPGFIGLNNLKHTDYVNVTVQALAHVIPIRNFFLQAEKYATCRSQLVSAPS